MPRFVAVYLAAVAVSGCYRHYGKTYSVFEKPDRPDQSAAKVKPRPPPVPLDHHLLLDIQILEACGLIEQAAVGAHLVVVNRATNQVVFSRAADANGRLTSAGNFQAVNGEALIVLVEGQKIDQGQASDLAKRGVDGLIRIPCRPSGDSIKPPELPKPGSYVRPTR